ncbi:unnamed protein product [Orchesella dallaii]|uniref:Uncharacterized protein n=1 Tax=Orchesella dallaii TaxID=48710 RepID=A0ABP1R454_9HEXA
MPLVLSGGANRMPSQGLQYRLSTGQIVTWQSPISLGARLSQPQRFQFLSRLIQFPQVLRQQQQQQPALKFFRNPNQVNYHQLHYSNCGNQPGVQRIYYIPQSSPGLSGGPAFAPVSYPIQQQQQQAAVNCTYFEDPSSQRPLQTRSPQMGVEFGRLPEVPVTSLAPRPAPPFTSKSSASAPPPPPPPSRNFSFK